MKKYQFSIPDDKIVDYIISELKDEGEAFIMHCGKVLEFQYESATNQVDLYYDAELQRTFSHESEIEEFFKELEDAEQNKLPSTSWIIQFYDKDGDRVDEIHFNDEAQAREAFSLYDEPASAKMYSYIDLIERNWCNHSESIIDTLEFGEE